MRLAFGLIGVVVAATCCLAGAPLRDIADYLLGEPDSFVEITIGEGDLEEDVLPYFSMTLPCDVNELQWGDRLDYGPYGWLALRFETSTACLDEFLEAVGAWPQEVDVYEFRRAVEEFEWQLVGGHITYVAEPADRIRLVIWVDRRTAQPVVYAFAERH